MINDDVFLSSASNIDCEYPLWLIPKSTVSSGKALTELQPLSIITRKGDRIVHTVVKRSKSYNQETDG